MVTTALDPLNVARGAGGRGRPLPLCPSRGDRVGVALWGVGAGLVVLLVFLGSAPPSGGPASRPATRSSLVGERRARLFLRRALDLIERGDYPRAVMYLRACISLCPGGGAARSARERLGALESAARDRLTLARDLISKGRLMAAFEELRAITRDYVGLRSAEEAREELARLEARPDFIALRHRLEAHNLLEKARRHLRREEVFSAWKLLRRLLSAYPDTPAAGEARRELRLLRTDPHLSALLRRQRAERESADWFALAENYRANAERLTGAARRRLLSRAREFYRRIVETYPNSPLAERARAALRDLVPTTRRSPPGTSPRLRAQR